MGFDVGFVEHVQPDAVGQLVEVGVVGVVTGPDGVEVEGLHQTEVLADLGVGDGLTVGGAVVVAVDAVQDYFLIVDLKAVAAPAKVAEADIFTDHVYHLAPSVDELHDKAVEVGGLCRPGQRTGYLQVHAVELMHLVGTVVGPGLIVVDDRF